MFLSFRRFIFNNFVDLLPSTSFGYRRLILKFMGVRISKSARVNSGFRIYGAGPLEILDDVWIGRNCRFYTIGQNGIKIGCKTELGPETVLNCQSHKTGDSTHRAGECDNHSIEIGNGIWIGTRATILCCHIGDGYVIGASSLVLKDMPENVMAAGIPAEIRKKLDD